MQVLAVLPLTQQENFEQYMEHVHVETVKNITEKLADVLEETCEDQPHHSCHWNPQSEVTGRYCEDCSPICRDQTNYLQFSQFAIGAALLLFSAEMHNIPTLSLLSDIVDNKSQVCLHCLKYTTIICGYYWPYKLNNRFLVPARALL